MSNDTDRTKWERMSKLVRDADCVPTPPDCRGKVMTRIAAPRRRLTWAYALAAVLIAVGGFIALLPRPSSPPEATRMAKKQAAPTPHIVKQQAAPEQIAKTTPVIEHRAVTAQLPRHRCVRRQIVAHAPKRTVVEQVKVAQRPPTPAVDQPTPPVTPTAPPVAIAIVTWPSAKAAASDSYSYAYTDRDTATGKTTECQVKRSGDSVHIYMEAKPETKEAPVKGSIDDEIQSTNV